MKKVIKESKETVSIDELNDEMFIGVEFDSGEKNIVLKVDLNKYTSLSLSDNNNYTRKVFFNSISDLCLDDEIKEAYVFDTHEERTEWLIGKK